MREHPIYIEFEKAILAQGTLENELTALTDVQVKELAKSEEKLSANFIANMKALAAQALQQTNDELDRAFLLEQLEGGMRTAFRTRFPKFETELQRDESGRMVLIYLDGRKVVADG